MGIEILEENAAGKGIVRNKNSDQQPRHFLMVLQKIMDNSLTCISAGKDLINFAHLAGERRRTALNSTD